MRQLHADVGKVDLALHRLTDGHETLVLVGHKPAALPTVAAPAHSSPSDEAACGTASEPAKADKADAKDDPARTRSGSRPAKRLGWAPALDRELPTPRVLVRRSAVYI